MLNSASVLTPYSTCASLDEAAGRLDVLAVQRGDHVAGREPARAQVVAAQPDPDRAVLAPERMDADDARDRLEDRRHLAAHVLARLDLGERRAERDPQDRLVVEVEVADHRRIHLGRQLAAHRGDLVAHLLRHHVEIGAELELDADLRSRPRRSST